MLLRFEKQRPDLKLLHCVLSVVFTLISVYGFTQRSYAVVKGTITDGTANKPLSGVLISSDSLSAESSAGGTYSIRVKSPHTIKYMLEGFQSKIITDVPVKEGETIYLDIILFPLLQTPDLRHLSDSLSSKDSVITVSWNKESRASIYNTIPYPNGPSDILAKATIQPGTDKNASLVLKRLNGVVVSNNFKSNNTLQTLTISGLGERYNQVLLNGAVLQSFDPVSRSYPLSLFPSEIIEAVELRRVGNASIPADFAGGTIDIKTKDIPDQNFFYVLAGANFSDKTINGNFFGDKRKKTELLGFPGSVRDLPADFPTTRSQSSLSQKNIQEQVYFSKKLNNNLAPVNHGPSQPGDRLAIGFGKIIQLKKGEKIGIVALLNQQKTELIQESESQVAPDVTANPYPFVNSHVLIRAHAADTSYQYASQLSATANASILFGRNKISFRNFFASQSANTYTRRHELFKPDEDTSAHTGVNYQSEQRTLLISQISGQHALGENSRLKIDWQASYSLYRQRNPDERNFLLRQNTADNTLFEIARPSAASLSSVDAMFTNSGRSWREYRDHNFSGAFNLQFPFNLFHQTQSLSGGIYIQTRYRVLFSDLLLTKGNGYFSLDELIAPERYFPGGLSVTNYYVRFVVPGGVMNPDAVNATHRANYTASSNIGASYIRFENKFTKHLSLNWGLRVESNSQLVSTSQYNYFTGYKNAQLGSLDENDRVTGVDLLPSAELDYKATDDILLHASFFRTINRPQLQELARFRYYDARSFLVKTGNPLLANTLVDNYDAGVTWAPNAGSYISVAGFYKEIDQPVEYILSGYANERANLFSTPHNTPPAIARGVNASFKISLQSIAPVSIFANSNWSKTKVAAGPVRSFGTPDVIRHRLSGSPDYTVNAGVVVQHPRFPMLTVLYNRIDDYITALGSGRTYTLPDGKSINAIPDYRVKGRDQLDIQVSQKLFNSNFQVIAGVNGLLQDRYIEYQDLNGNKKFDTPLQLRLQGNTGGFVESGIDNTVVNIRLQRSYYLTVSYLFK